jgi:uncharacterized membrane protein YqjE
MSEPAQPIVGRGKSLLDQLLRIAQTRLELLSAEVHREKLALTRQWQLAIVAVVCACLAGVTLITWIAIALPPRYRTTVLGVLFFALVLGAGACWLASRARARRDPVFSRVIHQLKLDRTSLGGSVAPTVSDGP